MIVASLTLIHLALAALLFVLSHGVLNLGFSTPFGWLWLPSVLFAVGQVIPNLVDDSGFGSDYDVDADTLGHAVNGFGRLVQVLLLGWFGFTVVSAVVSTVMSPFADLARLILIGILALLACVACFRVFRDPGAAAAGSAQVERRIKAAATAMRRPKKSRAVAAFSTWFRWGLPAASQVWVAMSPRSDSRGSTLKRSVRSLISAWAALVDRADGASSRSAAPGANADADDGDPDDQGLPAPSYLFPKPVQLWLLKTKAGAVDLRGSDNVPKKRRSKEEERIWRTIFGVADGILNDVVLHGSQAELSGRPGEVIYGPAEQRTRIVDGKRETYTVEPQPIEVKLTAPIEIWPIAVRPDRYLGFKLRFTERISNDRLKRVAETKELLDAIAHRTGLTPDTVETFLEIHSPFIADDPLFKDVEGIGFSFAWGAAQTPVYEEPDQPEPWGRDPNLGAIEAALSEHRPDLPARLKFERVESGFDRDTYVFKVRSPGAAAFQDVLALVAGATKMLEYHLKVQPGSDLVGHDNSDRSLLIRVPKPPRPWPGQLGGAPTDLFPYLKADKDPARDRRSFVVGLNRDDSPRRVTFGDQLPSLLIAGGQGGGKSVACYTTLAQLLLANRPDQMKLVIVDSFKQEITKIFRSAPHLAQPPVVATEGEDVLRTVREYYDRMNARYLAFNEEGDDRDLDLSKDDWWLLVLEEWAVLRLLLSDEQFEELLKLLRKITSIGRGAGFYLMIVTQEARATTTLPGELKALLKGRVSFYFPNAGEYRIVLDEDASWLPNVAGRMAASFGGAIEQLQGLYAPKPEVRQVIQDMAATYGPAKTSADGTSPEGLRSTPGNNFFRRTGSDSGSAPRGFDPRDPYAGDEPAAPRRETAGADLADADGSTDADETAPAVDRPSIPTRAEITPFDVMAACRTIFAFFGEGGMVSLDRLEAAMRNEQIGVQRVRLTERLATLTAFGILSEVGASGRAILMSWPEATERVLEMLELTADEADDRADGDEADDEPEGDEGGDLVDRNTSPWGNDFDDLGADDAA